jgi:hypothetical protein
MNRDPWHTFREARSRGPLGYGAVVAATLVLSRPIVIPELDIPLFIMASALAFWGVITLLRATLVACPRCFSPFFLESLEHREIFATRCVHCRLELWKPLEPATVAERIDAPVRVTLARGRCPYCADPLASGGLVQCARCQAPHHAECWAENGDRCTIFGCEPTRRRIAA